jgi:hypothetical protein
MWDAIVALLRENAGGIVISIVVAGLGLLGRALHWDSETVVDVEVFVKRSLDKANVWFAGSLALTSDGGSKITSVELSQLRDLIWKDALQEFKTGPVGKRIREWGEDYVKGLIGIALAKLGIKVGAPVPPELVRS